MDDRQSCVLRYLAIVSGADNPHPSMSLDKKDLHAADCIHCRQYTGLLGVTYVNASRLRLEPLASVICVSVWLCAFL